MIQRIQTVYLFLSALALSAQVKAPYLTTGENLPDLPPTLAGDHTFNIFDNIGIEGLTALALVCSLVGIFLYKNRKMQSQFAQLAVVVTILLAVLVGFALYQTETQLHGAAASLGLGLGLPVVAMVLQFLARRSIIKDEEKVRSMDRLR